MPETPSITAYEADQRANDTARQLVRISHEFNAHYPDQDAGRVAEYFDYVTHNYIVQTCAAVLAKRYLIVPEEIVQEIEILYESEDAITDVEKAVEDELRHMKENKGRQSVNA